MERTLCAEADKLRQFAIFVNSANLKEAKQILSVRKQIGTTVKGLNKLLEEPNLLSGTGNLKAIKKV